MDLPVDAVEPPPDRRVAPADHPLRVVPAVEPVVGDVEVARPRVVGEDADPDVLETGVLHREPLRPRDELLAGPDGELGVAERDALEVGVVGRHDVEEGEVAVAVEDDLAVARRLDDDRPLGRAVGRQVVGALERERRGWRRRTPGGCSGRGRRARGGCRRRAPGDARPWRSPRRRTRSCTRISAPRTTARSSCPRSRGDRRGTPSPPRTAPGSARVRTVTVRRASPITPSGSVITNRASYAVSGSRSRMLPANMLGTTTSNWFPTKIRSPCRRRRGSAGDHAVSPCRRYDTSTAAFRLSSPSMDHSKPRLISVGGSTRSSPAATAFPAPPSLAPVRRGRRRGLAGRSGTGPTQRGVRVDRPSHARETSPSGARRPRGKAPGFGLSSDLLPRAYGGRPPRPGTRTHRTRVRKEKEPCHRHDT